MNSLKTGVIIAFGLTVLYGVYLVINKPEPTAEAQAAADAVEELAIGEATDEEGAPKTAKEPETETPPLEHDAPAAEVAEHSKPNSRFHRHEEKEPPVESPQKPATEPRTTEEKTGSRFSDEEAGEAEVAPWRKKPAGEPEPVKDEEEKPIAEDRPAHEDEAAHDKPLKDEPVSDEPARDTKKEVEPVAEADTKAEAEKQEVVEPEVKIAPRETPALGAAEFETAWAKMEAEIEEGKLKEALTTISPFYHAADLTDDDYKQLLEVLDLLAWKVVFSKEHFLAKPHVVAAGETLDDIAHKYQVPAEVITKINGVKSTKLLTAGTELKIVPGPFRAEVSPTRGELTLFLGDLYATRYAVEVGTTPPPEEGEYTVLQRTPGAVYRTKNNRDIAAQDSRNPYGGVYLDLGDGQCLHGSPEEEKGEEAGAGCMRLRGKDAKEVYWLLSKGSKVSVVR